MTSVQDIPAPTLETTAIRVDNLGVVFPSDRGPVRALDNVSFSIARGRSLGIVGESGSGKTTLGYALFDSVQPPGRIVSGRVLYGQGVNFLELDAEQKRQAFGSRISMVFQGNQNTLNPLLRIRQQVEDIGKAHGYDRRQSELREKAANLFSDMSLDPARVLNAYPHELSGGMRQRVGIALALLLDPQLVVLDEPTTALDVLSQAAVLRILERIKGEGKVSFIFISHDISVVSQVVDEIAIMYGGHLVERGCVDDVISLPFHPYSQGLIGAIPPLWGSMDEVRPLTGHPPNLATMSTGCPFFERCPVRLTTCEHIPAPIALIGDREVACHLISSEGVAQ